ncbi:Glucanosyltransferase-domain-containing protein [Lophiotrema nucula]|uniref:1,3-beta-glucanosyltransferase n=1 Tax=Lophiotrema nucula TaxID=690887 RepID=A0A6A5ZRV4_9PLEO|nr:Glucanosyltransferase-domain-containing protein [Lophiotrema nucula]
MKSLSLAVAAGALFASSVSAAVDPIVIKGNKFFYKTNGTQFYMRGVAYQQGISSNTSQTETLDFVDPLADSKSCTRDIEFLSKLRTNTIRVYALDPTKNHDACMNALADAGIYVVADLSQPGESINREDAGWTTALLERYTSVVDMMQKYDNTLGFFAGNEVSNQPNNTYASAFVKAAVRDTKAYIKAKSYRTIGVGYATNDDADIRENLASYFDCGNREDAIDFWGYNIYSWCGDSSFQKSGYDVRTKEFESFDVPVFFAEYGCNQVQPRQFTEVQALYGSQMNDIWSGGIVYMYFQEANDFGLVSVDSSGTVKTNDDFKALSSQIAKVNPTGVKMADFNPTNTVAASCPTVNSDWGAVATPLPPAANTDLCSCMTDGLSCVVSSDVDEKDYSDIFDFVCGEKKGAYCVGIAKNATTGSFGAYGMCTPQQQLGYVLDQYSKNVTGGCDFKGQAKSNSPKSASNSCKSLLEQAGPQGTGTVTSAPGAAQTGKSSQGAAPGMIVPSFSTGLFSIGVYVFGAGLSGAAMILL